MSDSSGEHRPDWTERLVKIAGVFGFDETRLRWKLLRWRTQREEASERANAGMAHVRYAHAVCAECGRVQPRGTKECLGCGAPLSSHSVQVVRRLALVSPIDPSAGVILGAMIALCYVRQITYSGGSVMGFDVRTLLELGAHYPPLEWRGEWWRLGTAMFLHGGLMHVAFNMFALTQIGPPIEELFGRGRMLFLYMATGLIAFAPATIMHRNVPVIGASGAIMGLIGVAAGWGHRDGTSVGRAVRNQMLQWLLFTTIFGFMVRADHSAHVTGFLSGAMLGFFVKSRRMGGGSVRIDFALGAAAVLAAVACVLLVFLAPGRNLPF